MENGRGGDGIVKWRGEKEEGERRKK